MLALATLVAGPAFADCQDELGYARAGLGAYDYRIVAPGELSETGGRCRLEGLVLEQNDALMLEVEAISWTGAGFETLLIGAPDGLSLDLKVENARLVPQTSDPWMSYYLDLQNRHNFIDIEVVLGWAPDVGILEVERFRLDLPGENALELSSRITGATAEMMPGRLSGFDALTLEGFSLTVENAGYLDGLALGWMLGQLSLFPGEPETVVAGMLSVSQDIVAAWPDEVFPAASKAALATLIAAGPFPWGRLDVVMEEGEISLDRLVTLGMSPEPYGRNAMTDAWAGAVFDIRYEPSDGTE